MMTSLKRNYWNCGSTIVWGILDFEYKKNRDLFVVFIEGGVDQELDEESIDDFIDLFFFTV